MTCKEGYQFYLVGSGFWQLLTANFTGPNCKPVDQLTHNQVFLDHCKGSGLRKDVLEYKKDFVVVNARTWNALSNWYEGMVEARRTVIKYGGKRPRKGPSIRRNN